jgi:hypothetical protein
VRSSSKQRLVFVIGELRFDRAQSRNKQRISEL